MKSHGKHLRRSMMVVPTLGQNEGFGETQKEAPTPEPSVREVPSKVRMDMVVTTRCTKKKKWPLIGHFL